jgi:hypothetical protein
MNIISTCKGCVFAKEENEEQLGCALNRPSKLGIKETKDGFYTLNRFCAAYRPDDWLNYLSVSESVDIKGTVLKELWPRVGFFIMFNKDMDNLGQIINDIKSQTIPARYVVIINMDVEYNEDIYKLLTSNFDFKKTEYHIVQPLVKYEDENKFIDESFRHAKNGWAYFCRSSESIDHNLIEKIHQRVNIEMKKLVVIKPYDNSNNGLLFQTSLFKFLNGNGVKVFKDTSVDNRLFMDKVRDAAENSDSETFITWSEFNES